MNIEEAKKIIGSHFNLFGYNEPDFNKHTEETLLEWARLIRELREKDNGSPSCLVLIY